MQNHHYIEFKSFFCLLFHLKKEVFSLLFNGKPTIISNPKDYSLVFVARELVGVKMIKQKIFGKKSVLNRFWKNNGIDNQIENYLDVNVKHISFSKLHFPIHISTIKRKNFLFILRIWYEKNQQFIDHQAIGLTFAWFMIVSE